MADNFFSRWVRRLATTTADVVVKAKSIVRATGDTPSYFSPEARSPALLKKYQTIYKKGGPVSEALDAYPLFCTAKGWRLEPPDTPLAEMVQEKLDNMNFDVVMRQMILDAVVCGDSFAENAPNAAGEFIAVLPRDPATFIVESDEKGKITGYRQEIMVNGVLKKIPFKPQEITHLQLFTLGGEVYGESLIARAYDEIIRDAKVAEGVARAIERHGTPKWHVQVGKEGETVPEAVIDSIDHDLQDLKTKNELITTRDVTVSPLDKGSFEVKGYIEAMTQRVCTALGVPEELLGLGRGSTEATANVRLDAFYKKIQSLQKQIARTYSMNVIDKLTGKPGEVSLVFNDVSPSDEAEQVTWMAALIQAGASAGDPFAVLDIDEIRDRLGMEPKEEEEVEPIPEEALKAGTNFTPRDKIPGEDEEEIPEASLEDFIKFLEGRRQGAKLPLE